MEKDGGFTIIEVSLFLAISATLILLTVGLSALVSRQRFQDTMATLRTTIQSEYEEVRSGINTRLGKTAATGVAGCTNSGSTESGNSNCLILGKLIRFNTSANKSDILVNYIVAKDFSDIANFDGLTDSAAIQALSDRNKLMAISPTDAGAAQNLKKIEWGGEFAGIYKIKAGSPAINSAPANGNIAILRSPNSSAIMVFSDATVNSSTLKLSTANANTPLALIIKSGQGGLPGAAVCIDPGASSNNVRLAIPANLANYNINPAGTLATVPLLANLKGLCGV